MLAVTLIGSAVALIGSAATLAAKLAVGCAIQLVEAMMEEQIDYGIALVRPSGHHAAKDKGGGFCYFNNVAAAWAKLAYCWSVGHNGYLGSVVPDRALLFPQCHILMWRERGRLPAGDLSAQGILGCARGGSSPLTCRVVFGPMCFAC